MFGIGTTELLVIFVVALIILGPKKLPEIARTLGKGFAEFRRVSTDFQRTINVEVAREEQTKKAQEEQKTAAESTPAETAKPDPAKEKADKAFAAASAANEATPPEPVTVEVEPTGKKDAGAKA